MVMEKICGGTIPSKLHLFSLTQSRFYFDSVCYL